MLTEIVIAGSGGQGIQFAGQALARAAVHQGLNATYVPSYGAERRGGTSFCSVVVSDGPIYAPVFTRPDILLALDQRGRNNYGGAVKPEGLILANSDLAAAPAPQEAAAVTPMPASSLADQVCPGGALNLIVLGAFLSLTGLVELDHLRAVVEERSRKRPDLLASNLEALARGETWGREHRA